MRTIIKKEFLFSEEEAKFILITLDFFIKHNPSNKQIKIYENMAFLIREILKKE